MKVIDNKYLKLDTWFTYTNQRGYLWYLQEDEYDNYKKILYVYLDGYNCGKKMVVESLTAIALLPHQERYNRSLGN